MDGGTEGTAKPEDQKREAGCDWKRQAIEEREHHGDRQRGGREHVPEELGPFVGGLPHRALGRVDRGDEQRCKGEQAQDAELDEHHGPSVVEDVITRQKGAEPRSEQRRFGDELGQSREGVGSGLGARVSTGSEELQKE